MGRARRRSGKGGLVSHRCHLHVLDLINNGLGGVNMQMLKNSQFSHLFPFPSVRFQGQIFYILLRHLDMSSKYRNILTFTIGGCSLDFGPREFAFITGLSLNGLIDTPTESELHRTYFRGRYSISLVDIIEAFKTECCSTGGNSLNSLKLGCLMIVYGLFVTLGGIQNHVDMTYFHVVDNIEKFFCFPWGKITYESLVMRTHRARDLLESLLHRDKVIAFDANCFVLALQIWVYEVIPIIGRNCASRLYGGELDFPRMKSWEASYHIKFDKVHEFFTKLNAESLCPMIIGENEDKESRPLQHSTLNNYVAVVTNEANGCSNKLHNEFNDSALCNVRLHQSFEGNEVSLLKRRVSALENMILKVKKPTKAVKKEGKKTSTRGRSQVIPTDPAVFHHEAMMQNEESCLVSRVVLMSKPKHAMKTIIKYDPNKRGILPEWVEEFSKWHDSKNSSLLIPCRKVVVVDRSWFEPLWNRRGWLNSSHIDALITLLLVTSKNDPERFSTDWGAMEMICWDALCGDNLVTLRERVGPFVVGHQPETRPLHWAFASKVYGVGNVNGNHWVSYVLDFDKRMMTVFDSMSESSCWDISNNIFKTVCRNLDHLCNENHVWKLRSVTHESVEQWCVDRYNHPPQQKNTFDCGVMAIKFIECLISGNFVSILDSDRCGFFRQYYCAKLLRICVIDPVIHLCL